MSNVAGSDLLLLEGRGERHSVPFGGRLRVDHGLAARWALAAGRGIAPAHFWLVEDPLQTGRFTAVLPAYSPPPVPLYMLIVPSGSGIATVRLVEFLPEQIGLLPGIGKGRRRGCRGRRS